MKIRLSKWVISSLAYSALFLTGCTMTKPDGTPATDPFEKYNRAMFAFNQDVDHLVLKPVATVYDKATPPVVKKGVTNVFNNIDEIPTFSNDVLQGNVRYLFPDFWRFVINTTLGVGGLFDVATRFGIHKHVE